MQIPIICQMLIKTNATTNLSTMFGPFQKRISDFVRRFVAMNETRQKRNSNKSSGCKPVALHKKDEVGTNWIKKIVRRGLGLHEKIIFHQDNASTHTGALVMGKLRDLEYELLEYPPYPPDLEPSDFYLFLNKKKT